MARQTKKDQDLYRGDDRTHVSLPVPTADPSIVRHILYQEGKGRETPYLSTSESEEVAERFDNNAATAVWRVTPRKAETQGVGVVSLKELQQLLRGEGHGAARCTGKHARWLVRRALQLAETQLEHLLDFRGVDLGAEQLRPLVDHLFTRR